MLGESGIRGKKRGLFHPLEEFACRVQLDRTVLLYREVLLVEAARAAIGILLVGVVVTRGEFGHCHLLVEG